MPSLLNVRNATEVLVCNCGRITHNASATCARCLDRDDQEGLDHGRPRATSRSYVKVRSSRSPRYRGPRCMA